MHARGGNYELLVPSVCILCSQKYSQSFMINFGSSPPNGVLKYILADLNLVLRNLWVLYRHTYIHKVEISGRF